MIVRSRRSEDDGCPVGGYPRVAQRGKRVTIAGGRWEVGGMTKGLGEDSERDEKEERPWGKEREGVEMFIRLYCRCKKGRDDTIVTSLWDTLVEKRNRKRGLAEGC
ncbi:hypothetical protein TREMEDRAFT_57606 [Tremella mesenterica DSM 1558]|uniref:uncharacterized protein n=1 Tax=Tremella mesenterica (strain ATCC 24925 / CBS 8224 / DSM 1558 / NBRC 9311 / NRRL Y-6157 / RJB 2259-6 / UBC 559-6) TaxID=578456 RepID=UPI0003F491DC|nr:uncharacterized protein TREMEDRAFT_57606 [Tremella mesenterica DSM 1558]EIW67446.1 hypothetical protein TREMEDRAFT_57606 [Tremella mesenterica DSM 1558]